MIPCLMKRRNKSEGEKATADWQWQRGSALLLVPLSLWLILSFRNIVYSGYDQSLAWVSTPFIAILICVTLVIFLFHGHLGVSVVIEDYVQGPWKKRGIKISMLLNTLIGLCSIAAIVMLFITKS